MHIELVNDHLLIKSLNFNDIKISAKKSMWICMSEPLASFEQIGNRDDSSAVTAPVPCCHVSHTGTCTMVMMMVMMMMVMVK